MNAEELLERCEAMLERIEGHDVIPRELAGLWIPNNCTSMQIPLRALGNALQLQASTQLNGLRFELVMNSQWRIWQRELLLDGRPRV